MAEAPDNEVPPPTPPAAPEIDPIGLAALKRVLLESKAREANFEVQLEIARMQLEQAATEIASLKDAEIASLKDAEPADLAMVEDLDIDIEEQ